MWTVSGESGDQELKEPNAWLWPRWVGVRWAFLVACVAVAYWHSGVSVAQQCVLGAPVEVVFCSLFWAVLIGLGVRTRQSLILPIHDRQVDWTAGLIGLLLSVLVLYMMMPRLGFNELSWRADVLSGWIFLMAGVILLFGLRCWGRYRLVWLFCAVSWPVFVLWLGAQLGGTTRAYALVTAALGALAAELAVGGKWYRRLLVTALTFVVAGGLVVASSHWPQVLAIGVPGTLGPLVIVVGYFVVTKTRPLDQRGRETAFVVKEPRNSYGALALVAVVFFFTAPTPSVDAGVYGRAHVSFERGAVSVKGWQSGVVRNVVKQSHYYGEGAWWHRVLYASTDRSLVSVDALLTSSKGLLATYPGPINYHYLTPIQSAGKVRLGRGVVATMYMTNISQIDTQHQQIFEMLTYSRQVGTHQYERFTLFTPVGPQTTFSLPVPSAPLTSSDIRSNVALIVRGTLPDSTLNPDPAAMARLVRFARYLVRH